MKIVAYHSADAETPHMRWIGYIQKGGVYIGIRFNAETKAEVEKKAKFWYENQTKPKVYQLETTEEDFQKYKDEQEELAPEPAPKKIFPSQVRVASTSGGGRGHGLVGSIWVINKKTHERRRIKETEMSEYAAQGFIRGKKL